MAEITSNEEKFDIRSEFLQFAVVGIIAVFSIVILMFLGFAGGGFTDKQFSEFFSFYGIFQYFLFGVFCILIAEIATSGKWARVIIYDPSRSPSVVKNIKLFRNPIKVIALFLMLGVIISFAGVSSQTMFIPSGKIPQQMAEAASFYGQIEPAATQETFLMMFIMCFLFTISLAIINKLKLERKNYLYLAAFIIWILIIVSGVTLHLLRYGANEGNLLSTGFFWGVAGGATILTGSIIPIWIMHWMNNFFLAFKSQFASEIFKSYSVILIVVVSVICLIILLWKPKKEINVT